MPFRAVIIVAYMYKYLEKVRGEMEIKNFFNIVLYIYAMSQPNFQFQMNLEGIEVSFECRRIDSLRRGWALDFSTGAAPAGNFLINEDTIGNLSIVPYSENYPPWLRNNRQRIIDAFIAERTKRFPAGVK